MAWATRCCEPETPSVIDPLSVCCPTCSPAPDGRPLPASCRCSTGATWWPCAGSRRTSSTATASSPSARTSPGMSSKSRRPWKSQERPHPPTWVSSADTCSPRRSSPISPPPPRGAGGETPPPDPPDRPAPRHGALGLIVGDDLLDIGRPAGLLEATAAVGLARPDLTDDFPEALKHL